jgi:hypothetical protein
MTKRRHLTKDQREEIPLDELLTLEKPPQPLDRDEQSDIDDGEEDEYDVMNRIEKQDK